MGIIIHNNNIQEEDTKEKMTELKTDLIITENAKNDFDVSGNDENVEEKGENNTKKIIEKI